MYAQNEQIHIASWPCFGILDAIPALSAVANLNVSSTYALEGSCFVITSTQITSDEGIKTFELVDGSMPPIHNGGGGFARVFGPDSSLRSEVLDEHTEGIVTADIDLATIAYAKNAADSAAHYNRPDVTQLLFDNSAKRVVVGSGTFGTEIAFPELAVSQQLAPPPREL